MTQSRTNISRKWQNSKRTIRTSTNLLTWISFKCVFQFWRYYARHNSVHVYVFVWADWIRGLPRLRTPAYQGLITALVVVAFCGGLGGVVGAVIDSWKRD